MEGDPDCTHRGKPQGTILFQKGINHLSQKHTTAKKDHTTHRQKTATPSENRALTSVRKAAALTWLISLVSCDRIVTPMMQCSTLSWLKEGKAERVGLGFSIGNAVSC